MLLPGKNRSEKEKARFHHSIISESAFLQRGKEKGCSFEKKQEPLVRAQGAFKKRALFPSEKKGNDVQRGRQGKREARRGEKMGLPGRF